MIRMTLAALSLTAVLSLTCIAAAPQHDRVFWRAIEKDQYAVPANESADALAPELSAMLASPDPELRDELAYSILAAWIHRGAFTTPTLISLTDEWRGNLKSGIGETGTNSVLKRSFSALCLSEMAKREAKSLFMGEPRYHGLVSEAAAYLIAERDVRGYDASLHWIHAAAHTADLLAALADSPLLTNQEAAAILQAIDSRLATTTTVYTQGEQDRLAAAVVAVLRRKDFDSSTFAPWLSRLPEEDRNVWTNTTENELARFQNHNYLLQAMVARLALQPPSAEIEKYKSDTLKLLASRLD